MTRLVRASLVVSPADEEIVAAELLELVPAGHEVTRHADGVELAVYVDEADVAGLRACLPPLRLADVPAGWEDEWKRFHVPARVGPLWVGPPWERLPDDALAVVVEPGRAFGTGAHPTTQLCLEFLLELRRGSVLDIGCGSGVLAVAAARLGFSPVTAVDIDGVAVEATRRNAERNGVDLAARRADALADELPRADVALANLELSTVEALARRLRCRLLVASGYLASDQPSLLRFVHVERRSCERWAADLYARE